MPDQEEEFSFPEADFKGAVGEGEEYLIRTLGKTNYEALQDYQTRAREAELAVAFAQANKINSLAFLWSALGCAVQKVFDLATVEDDE